MAQAPEPSPAEKPSALAPFKEAAKDFMAEDCPTVAAALSFYAVAAIPPLVVLLTAIFSLVYSGPEAAQHLVHQVSNLFGASTGQTVGEILQRRADSPNGTAAVTGLVVLLVGASGFFAQLQKALNQVWGVEPDPNAGWKDTVFKRVISMTVVLGTGFLLLVSLIVSAFIAAASRWLEAQVGLSVSLAAVTEAALGFALVTGLFALIFMYLPDVEVRWSDVWRGAAATSLFFMVGKFALGWYLGRSDFSADYGSAGALVLILFWVYYSSMILLYGAELTQAQAKARGHAMIPQGHARIAEPAKRAQAAAPTFRVPGGRARA